MTPNEWRAHSLLHSLTDLQSIVDKLANLADIDDYLQETALDSTYAFVAWRAIAVLEKRNPAAAAIIAQARPDKLSKNTGWQPNPVSFANSIVFFDEVEDGERK